MPRAEPVIPARTGPGTFDDYAALKEASFALQLKEEDHALELDAKKTDRLVSQRLRVLAGAAYDVLDKVIHLPVPEHVCEECHCERLIPKLLELKVKAAAQALDRSAHVAKRVLEVNKVSTSHVASLDPVDYIMEGIMALPEERRWQLILKVRALEVPQIVDLSGK